MAITGGAGPVGSPEPSDNEGEGQSVMRLRTASSSVGWLNSEGPLAVSPQQDSDQSIIEKLRAELAVLTAHLGQPLTRLRDDLRLREANWDSYGAAPVTQKALDAAALLHSRWDAAPVNSGGVQLELHTHGVDLEIELDAEGQVVSVFHPPTAKKLEAAEAHHAAHTPYLQHQKSCTYRPEIGWDEGDPCTCGLFKLLARGDPP